MLIRGQTTDRVDMRFTPWGDGILTFDMRAGNTVLKCEAKGRLADDIANVYDDIPPGTRVAVRGEPKSRRYRGTDGKTHVVTVLEITELAYRDKAGEGHRFE